MSLRQRQGKITDNSVLLWQPKNRVQKVFPKVIYYMYTDACTHTYMYIHCITTIFKTVE